MEKFDRVAGVGPAALVDGLVQLSFAVQAVLAAAAAEHELTVPQVRLLGILRDREPGMLQLAGHLGLDKSSVTGLVDRAERRGLVRRVASRDDGRAVRVAVTELGRALIDRAEGEIGDRVRALAVALTEAESVTLTALLDRMLGGRLGPASDSTW